MLSIKVAHFLVLTYLTGAFSEKHPEISYIDSDALGMLQEILAAEFESIHKKIDSLTTTTTTTPTVTTTTTETPTETTTPTPTTTTPTPTETPIEVMLLMVFGIIGITGIILTTICLVCLCFTWKRKKQSYSPNKKMVTTRARPTNRDSWFPNMSG